MPGLNVVKVSVADVRVEHEVRLMDFTKRLDGTCGSPRKVSDRIQSILGMTLSRSPDDCEGQEWKSHQRLAPVRIPSSWKNQGNRAIRYGPSRRESGQAGGTPLAIC